MSLLLTNPAANHLTKRKEKTMIKRLLNYSPKEMLQLTSEELFYAMKMDEGRTVEGLANCAAPNYLEDTSNAEVCAAFGCDVVFLDGHNPDNVVFRGSLQRIPKMILRTNSLRRESARAGR